MRSPRQPGDVVAAVGASVERDRARCYAMVGWAPADNVMAAVAEANAKAKGSGAPNLAAIDPSKQHPARLVEGRPAR